jgi:hypothetical protein
MPIATPQRTLSAQLQEAYALHQAASARSCLAYLNSLTIDCRPEPAPFRTKADAWQWEICKRLVPAIESVSSLPGSTYKGPTSFWLTLPRGHDKTSLIGRLMNWALAFSRLQLDAVAAAADRDQANFIVDKMRTEARLNPWLEPLLYFRNHVVKGPQGSTLKVISADARSNYGLSPDLIICDELTQWPNQANWDSLTTAKRKRGRKAVHIVITNAGVRHTWQWDVLQQAKQSPKAWWVYEAPGPICSWMDLEAMEQDRKTMLPAIARQMIDNEWLDPAESCGFVTRAEAEACADPGLFEQAQGLPGQQYVLSIDYGPVKDRTILAVLHKPLGSEKTIVDRLDVLQGSKKNRVPIESVEAWIDLQRQRFDVALLVVDPYQMEATIQKYETRLPVERFEPRGGKANYELAQALRAAVVSRQLAWPPLAGAITQANRKVPHTIADELAELIVKTHSYGYRIDHLPNRHDDRCVALGMGHLALLRRSLKRPLDRYAPEDIWW